jgi:hypothetical protein
MKNIHILPTDKPSRLVLDTVNNNLFLTTTEDFGTNIMKFQNIYITSDEEIKVILTTDQDLIKDGVQAIDDEFLEWFVQNLSCEVVEIFVDTMGCSLENCNGNPCVNYKITLPQEEPEISDEAKERAKNYMALKGVLDKIHQKPLQDDWEDERRYSEEDMIEFNEWSETSKESADFWRKNRRTPTMGDSYNLYMREKRVELFKIWKEQYKK